MIQQPPPYNAQPQMITIQQPNSVVVGTVTNSQERPGAWKAMLGTGITQLVFGILTVILGIVTLSVPTVYNDGTPIWNGICFYCVAGILGIIAGKTKHKCPTIGYMVMSIFACLSAIGVLASTSISLSITCSYNYVHYSPYYTSGCQSGALVAVSAILLIVAFAEFILAIIGASCTCGAVCCPSQPARALHYYPQQGQAVVVQHPAAALQPVGLAPQQQQHMVYPPQPAMYPAQAQNVQPAMPPTQAQNFQPAYPSPAQPLPGKSVNEPAPGDNTYMELTP